MASLLQRSSKLSSKVAVTAAAGLLLTLACGEPVETCDCDSSAACESGCDCDPDCSSSAVCGNGELEAPAEHCDDGDVEDCGACNADCSGPGTGVPCGGPVTFGAPVSHAVADGPVAVVAALLDADSVPDLAVVSLGTNSVAILLGAGDGSFVQGATCDAGLNPYAIAAADLDGDGSPDLAVADRDDDTASVLLANGDGTFAAAVAYAVGTQPRSLTLGDFNGDSILDLATANIGSRDVSILLGQGSAGVGDGSFGAVSSFAVGAALFAITAGDFNGDSILDLASVSYLSNSAYVLLGNGTAGRGDGTFATPSSYAVGAAPMSLVHGQLDDDASEDLAVANMNGHSISILLNSGGAVLFEAATTFVAGAHPAHVTAARLHRDAVLDLAVANQDGDTVSVLQGNGDGTFASPVEYAAGVSPSFVIAHDLDGDGLRNLVVTNFGDDSVSVLLAR